MCPVTGLIRKYVQHKELVSSTGRVSCALTDILIPE
jgi:hypothetical protein